MTERERSEWIDRAASRFDVRRVWLIGDERTDAADFLIELDPSAYDGRSGDDVEADFVAALVDPRATFVFLRPNGSLPHWAALPGVSPVAAAHELARVGLFGLQLSALTTFCRTSMRGGPRSGLHVTYRRGVLAVRAPTWIGHVPRDKRLLYVSDAEIDHALAEAEA